MWRVTLRDLQWRRRRFGIAVIGTALVFALTLVLAGFSASFRTEVDNTIGGLHGDAWVVAAGSSGPFTGVNIIPRARVSEVARENGVQAAEPVVFLHESTRLGTFHDLNLIGYRSGSFAEPRAAEGRGPQTVGEAIADRTLGLRLGDEFKVGGHSLRVVGMVSGFTAYGGIPNAYVLLPDAQAIGLQGRDGVTSILTRGVPEQTPLGLETISNAAARDDMMRPLLKAISTIDLIQLLLWIVAASIVGSVIYLNAMERVRDFAILKATGAPTRALIYGLAAQAILVSLLAALLSTGLAVVLARFFPIAVEVPVNSLLLLPAVALVVGLVASAAGARRALSADPAVAFSA